MKESFRVLVVLRHVLRALHRVLDCLVNIVVLYAVHLCHFFTSHGRRSPRNSGSISSSGMTLHELVAWASTYLFDLILTPRFCWTHGCWPIN
jgi:hypothetical protein